MRSTRRRAPSRSRRALFAVFGLCLAAGWFVWLRPTTLGGQQTYVIVQGPSMEPTYHDGDLVIVREEESYAVGDIIAFRIGGTFDDQTRIIHRIAGRDGDDERFLTQGDNRDSLDPWKPGPDEIIGRAVLHAPHLGDLAATAGQPQVLAALGGAAVMFGRNRRRRRPTPPVPADVAVVPSGTPSSSAVASAPEPARPSDRTVPVPRNPRWLRHTEPRWAFVGLLMCSVLALPTFLALWSAIQSSTRELRIQPVGTLEHTISVDYSFAGQPSPIYPSGVVTTTESQTGIRAPAGPVFNRLLQRLDLTVDFDAGATGAEEFTSTYALDVMLRLPQGFSRTLIAVEPTPFDGATTEAVSVDLVDVAAQVAEINALTGLTDREYTIELRPQLVLDARGGGATASDTPGSSVSFVVRDGVINAQPVSDEQGSVPLASQVAETTRYRLGPLAVETPTARGLLSGLALVLLVGAGWFASVLFGGIGLREADRIAVRYRTQLVDVSSATGPPGPVVMVGGIAELARLAKVEGSVILHEDLGDGAHRYRVFLGAVTYEYETAPEHAAGAMDAADPSSPSSPSTGEGVT